ncbi:MAG: hypothetical protein WBA17_06125 [Saprospiraceae bacterium]
MRILLLLLAGLLLFPACEKEVIPAPVDGLDTAWYPLAIGSEWIYRVDSITLIPAPGVTLFDSVRFEAREILTDTFTAADGQQWYRGERQERSTEADPWVFRQTFLAGFDMATGRALRQEDNIRFTKLILPARDGRSWDGHAAFDEFRQYPVGPELLDIYANWDYRMDSVDQPAALPTGSQFDRTLFVQQAKTDGLIDLRHASETYAYGVGRIRREWELLHTQCRICCNNDTGTCLDLPWRAKAEKGFIIREYLVSFTP